jgi:hypothetical protein
MSDDPKLNLTIGTDRQATIMNALVFVDADGKPVDAPADLAVSSSDETVLKATIDKDDLVMVPVSEGTATITATGGGKSSPALTVTVKKPTATLDRIEWDTDNFGVINYDPLPGAGGESNTGTGSTEGTGQTAGAGFPATGGSGGAPGAGGSGAGSTPGSTSGGTLVSGDAGTLTLSGDPAQTAETGPTPAQGAGEPALMSQNPTDPAALAGTAGGMRFAR